MRTAEMFGDNEFMPFAPLKSGKVVPAETAKSMERRKELELGMVKCPECGGEAKIETEGEASGQPVVYAGCFRTEKCAGRSVRGEGWDEEDGAREWNRRNGGIVGWWIRLKNWLVDKRAEKGLEWGFRIREFKKRHISSGEVSGNGGEKVKSKEE